MHITVSSPRLAGRMRQATLVGLALAVTACGWSDKATGTAVGVTAAAAAGAAVGDKTGSTARGAIIGAVVGGAAGAIIGSRMDKQAEELGAAIPGAVVERVGEGLVVAFASGLLYDFDSDAIRPEAGRNLRSLAMSLNKYSDGGRIHISGKGATEPVATNDTEFGRQANRRIEVAIYATAPDRSGSR